jgi:predicted RNA binding protein YcfA (HicA-like mRNA interferase family)
MKPLPFREVVRKLEAAGFGVVSQKGSHVKYAQVTSAGSRTVIVPRHREVSSGMLRSILRQADLSLEDFEAL